MARTLSLCSSWHQMEQCDCGQQICFRDGSCTWLARWCGLSPGSSTWAFPPCGLSTWLGGLLLACILRASAPKLAIQKDNAQTCIQPQLTLYWHHTRASLMAKLSQCGRKLHKRVKTRRCGSLGATQVVSFSPEAN